MRLKLMKKASRHALSVETFAVCLKTVSGLRYLCYGLRHACEPCLDTLRCYNTYVDIGQIVISISYMVAMYISGCRVHSHQLATLLYRILRVHQTSLTPKHTSCWTIVRATMIVRARQAHVRHRRTARQRPTPILACRTMRRHCTVALRLPGTWRMVACDMHMRKSHAAARGNDSASASTTASCATMYCS